jgi:hypothetical protein
MKVHRESQLTRPPSPPPSIPPQVTPDGRLPDAKQGHEHLRDIFYRMGFVDREIVALSGAHALGRAHADRSGFDGAWTKEPLVFDNAYFKELLAKEADPSLLKLPSDLTLLDTPSMSKWVKLYAEDEQLFFRDYAAAHLKLSELGQVRVGGRAGRTGKGRGIWTDGFLWSPCPVPLRNSVPVNARGAETRQWRRDGACNRMNAVGIAMQ